MIHVLHLGVVSGVSVCYQTQFLSPLGNVDLSLEGGFSASAEMLGMEALGYDQRNSR